MTGIPGAQELEESLEESSGEVRRAFLWFGTFAAYFVTTVAATTHENLLRGTAVKLPLLNVDLPIVGFYVIAPALFLLLHFYLLFQLYLMGGRARELIAAAGPQTARALAPSFPVTQYLLGGLGAFRPVFGLGIIEVVHVGEERVRTEYADLRPMQHRPLAEALGVALRIAAREGLVLAEGDPAGVGRCLGSEVQLLG